MGVLSSLSGETYQSKISKVKEMGKKTAFLQFVFYFYLPFSCLLHIFWLFNDPYFWYLYLISFGLVAFLWITLRKFAPAFLVLLWITVIPSIVDSVLLTDHSVFFDVATTIPVIAFWILLLIYFMKRKFLFVEKTNSISIENSEVDNEETDDKN